MLNKYGIDDKIFECILNVFKQNINIQEVKLFGSRSRGDYKKTSDIDLAVKFVENTNDKLLLIRSLDELRCILKFDVLNIDEISNSLLKEKIDKEGITIYIK